MPHAPETEWTGGDLEQTLYKWDPDAASIHEIKILAVDNTPQPKKGFLSRWLNWNMGEIKKKEENIHWNGDKKEKDQREDTEGEEQDEDDEGLQDLPPTYLEIDLTDDIKGDVAHVVLFYAEWCPHCKHYKPEYIALEAEINRRSIHTTVKFHAVSCSLNESVCRTYGVDGYPTAMGWSAASLEYRDIKARGALLNEEEDMTADSIAEDLQFDIAEEGVKYDEPEEIYSNSEDQKAYTKDKIQWGIDAALEKVRRYEHVQDINDRYHNGAASLTYILKAGVYASSGDRLNQEQRIALRDFLNLVYWATPLHWNVRTKLVQELLDEFNHLVTGKDALVQIVEKHQGAPLKKGRRKEELLWGYVDERVRTREVSSSSGSASYIKRRRVVGLGGDSHRRFTNEIEIVKENSSWTGACTHGVQYSGYTCGLWDLFHILTIGSTHTHNQLFGFRQGFIVSSREVAFVIRNFIANFFRCDVCKNHFLQMYDECSFSHCQRLQDRLPFARDEWFGLPDLAENMDDVSDTEVALWLWEVHNAVNLRLMREAAERDRREISKEETLASKFPTKRLCPTCWLDENLESFDPNEVTKFLLKWYWPTHEREETILSSTDVHRADSMDGTSLSLFGLFIVGTPLIVFILLISRDAIKKRKKTSAMKAE